MEREGFDVARCMVARLMKSMGIQGIIRGKPHRTTISDKKFPCPPHRQSHGHGSLANFYAVLETNAVAAYLLNSSRRQTRCGSDLDMPLTQVDRRQICRLRHDLQYDARRKPKSGNQPFPGEGGIHTISSLIGEGIVIAICCRAIFPSLPIKPIRP
ncbi:hypothetical protein C0V82_01165 [Niveispirillum cyanobacteriorum]|uniref:HTH-like domain-containing protein n=1 Tax=Niveispirillum cyanobacteriorum TaxID=1612173 RepID=A0A2K9N7B1_9PROT|nr:hypothetical protein C0V82_01165 [Niveispirillum cyanobacteriorum]